MCEGRVVIGSAPVDRDAALVARLQAGDAGALHCLVEEDAAAAYRVAYGITRSETDAEGVVRDVLGALLRTLGRLERRAALRAWLLRRATHAALSVAGGAGPKTVAPGDGPAFQVDGHRTGDPAYLLADWSERPDAVASGPVRAALDRAFQALPPGDRAALVLGDVEGLGAREVAEVLDEPVAVAKARLHRARMVLREAVTRQVAGAAAPAPSPAGPPGALRAAPAR